MDVGLAIAGALSVLLALGHTTIGVIWVLPGLHREELPKTPFGSVTLTESMIRVTWYIVTIFAAGTGGLLLTLATLDGADPKTVVLRWLAALWLVATVMAAWVSLPRVRSLRGLLRLPVPLVWMLIAVLCWNAST